MSSKLDLILHANQFRRAESPEDIENVKADIKTLMLEMVDGCEEFESDLGSELVFDQNLLRERINSL